MGAATRCSGIPQESTSLWAAGASAVTAPRTASGTPLHAEGGSSPSPTNHVRSASTRRRAYRPHTYCNTVRVRGEAAFAAAQNLSSTIRSPNAAAVACTRSDSCFIHTSKVLCPVLCSDAIRAPSSPTSRDSRIAKSHQSTRGLCSPPSGAEVAGFAILICPLATRAMSSLATFCMRTRLSPSAVIPACANPMSWPNLLTERYPCPPHRSRATVAAS
mmetsp:Transcript_45828/g.146164  ORF Transcript_45828/g.146164 Transcript_45828/m.146164 type:complete len:217 (-) Transcript_45828:1194-1844(-)